MELMFFDFCYKSRTKIGDTERNWRLPSSPIVERKHVHFLCSRGCSSRCSRSCDDVDDDVDDDEGEEEEGGEAAKRKI